MIFMRQNDFATRYLIDDGDNMGRYIVSFKVNWGSFPVDQLEKAKILERIHVKSKEAMEKGILVYWGIALDLTHGYAVWNADAGEMAKIAVLRLPYLEPLEIKELFTLDQFLDITREVAK